MSKKLDLNKYLPSLRESYERDVLHKVVEVLIARGVPIEKEDDIQRLFRERIKKTVHEGITTLTLDGCNLCAYGELHAEVDGPDVNTSFKFTEL